MNFQELPTFITQGVTVYLFITHYNNIFSFYQNTVLLKEFNLLTILKKNIAYIYIYIVTLYPVSEICIMSAK